MGKWLDIKGAVVADTVYADNVLVAKDVSFTLPGIEFVTADVQAMGNMTVPLVGLLENMELAITKIGVDMGVCHVPIVPAAVVFDLMVGDAHVRPDAAMGREACLAASKEVRQGAFGAGTGATVGKMIPGAIPQPGGVGTASIRLAGGVNAAAEIADAYWVGISYEQLLAWDPEYIVLASDATYTVEDVLADKNLSACKAVVSGNVYQLPSKAEAWDSPVPSGILGAVWLANVLHPDLFSQETCEALIDEYYETFYGFTYSEN